MATTEMTRPGGASTSTSQGVSGELAGDATRLKDTAKERALQAAESGKGQATQAAKSTSEALDKAADELRQDENAPDWLASAFKKTASGIESFASDIDQRSPEQLGRDVSRFARQNPTAFLAASAAAGFAAARFLRAGSQYQQDHQFDTESYGSAGGVAGSPSYAGSTGSTGSTYSDSTSTSGSTYTTAGEGRVGGAEGGTVL